MNDYEPIACSTHDRLEHFAVRRTVLRVRYASADGAEHDRSGRIADLYARDGAEYLRLDDGTEVRLDHLREVRPA